jgi:hypothetical protein
MEVGAETKVAGMLPLEGTLVEKLRKIEALQGAVRSVPAV